MYLQQTYSMQTVRSGVAPTAQLSEFVNLPTTDGLMISECITSAS